MKAIILAGGKGTRLRDVAPGIPKPMVLIDGKPFLQYLLDYLNDFHVSDVVLAVGYKYKVIRDFFGGGYKDVAIEYSIEEKPLGTGGAIKEALNFVSEDHVFIFNGDTFFPVNLAKMFREHKDKNAAFTIALKKMINFRRYGSVLVQNGKITKFNEKKFRESGFINGGVYLIKRTVQSYFPPQESFSFEKDVMEKKTADLEIRPYIEDVYFIDIGIPEDYRKAQKDFIGRFYKTYKKQKEMTKRKTAISEKLKSNLL